MRLIFITHIHTTIYLFIMKITSVEMSFNQLKNVVFSSYFGVVKDFFFNFYFIFWPWWIFISTLRLSLDVASRASSLATVCRLLIAVASLVVAPRLESTDSVV